MSEYEEHLKIVENLLKTAQMTDEKYESCVDLYEFLGIDRKEADDKINSIIEEKYNHYLGLHNVGKWDRFAKKFTSNFGSIQYILLKKRPEYDNHLKGLKVKELQKHFVSRTRDKKLDSDERFELIMEGNELGLTEAETNNIVDKWIKEYSVKEVDSPSYSSPDSSTTIDKLLNKTWYEILGVSKNATAEEIERAYQDHYARLNKIRDVKRKEAEWPAIDAAYRILIDPKQREKYDEGLGKPPPTPPGIPQLVVLCKSEYTFTNIKRGSGLTEKIIIKNPEGGQLKGTMRSDSPWIVLDRDKLLEKHEQPLKIDIITAKIPSKTYNVKGNIFINTNGGNHTIPFSVFLEDFEKELSRFRSQIIPSILIASVAIGVLIGSVLAPFIITCIGLVLLKTFFNFQYEIRKYIVIISWTLAVLTTSFVLIPFLSTLDSGDSTVSSRQPTISIENVKPLTDAALPPSRQQIVRIVTRDATLRSNHFQQATSIESLSYGDQVTVLERWFVDSPDAHIILRPTNLMSPTGPIGLQTASIVYLAAVLENKYIVTYKIGEREITGEIPNNVSSEIGNQIWYKVRTRDGQEGWISSNFIE